MPAEVEAQFQDAEKQRDAAHLGMWVFLVSEILLFGGLFTLYGCMRLEHPEAFARAADHTSLWIMTAGTVVL
ncbi:MAG TPA: hypothetical protein VE173_04930, partial [Longimicrobiales bacterium]|nr:hypothetical protein [Longimicrobiales bacterium]